MNSIMRFDDATTRRLASSYTTSDVVEQRRTMLTELGLRTGDHVLDIGSGPGLLAADMAEAVGPAGSVQGIDPSESMLALARQQTESIEFRSGDANELPFADESFDVVTSTQVYEYVTDLPGALAEARRVLKPGGRLAVLDTDWDSLVWHSSDPARARRILSAWDGHLADPHLPRRLTRLLRDAGFTVRRRTTIPLFNAGYDVRTFSAHLIDFVAAFVPGRDGVTEDDVRAWAEDLASLGDDYFFSVNRYLFIAGK